jgi:hypothetical protein
MINIINFKRQDFVICTQSLRECDFRKSVDSTWKLWNLIMSTENYPDPIYSSVNRAWCKL